MKIGISGSAGTGKSTFVKFLTERTGIPVIPEMAREIFKEFGIRTPHDLKTEEDKLRFQFRITEEMKKAHNRFPEFISDRTGADSAAYWMVFNSMKAPFTVTKNQLDDCERLCRDLDFLVLFPPDRLPFLEDDGVRSMNPYYQLKMYFLIKSFLDFWKTPYLETREKDNEKLLNEILRISEAKIKK